ncbi:hypothetical protein Dimus_027569, partial [Dionaea muscipula]
MAKRGRPRKVVTARATPVRVCSSLPGSLSDGALMEDGGDSNLEVLGHAKEGDCKGADPALVGGNLGNVTETLIDAQVDLDEGL